MADDKVDAIFGLELRGHGRKFTPFQEKNHLIFPDNNSQNYLERDARCWVHTIKVKRTTPREIQDLFNIIWEKDRPIHGEKLYCECSDCKEPGKIKKRFLKGGLPHGQNIIFSGENSLSFILRPITKTGAISLKDLRTLDQVKITLIKKQEQLDKENLE